MRNQRPPKTRRPTAADRVFVADIVERLGISAAARELGLSRLATLNVAHGGDCYQCTLERVAHARLVAMSGGQAA